MFPPNTWVRLLRRVWRGGGGGLPVTFQFGSIFAGYDCIAGRWFPAQVVSDGDLADVFTYRVSAQALGATGTGAVGVQAFVQMAQASVEMAFSSAASVG